MSNKPHVPIFLSNSQKCAVEWFEHTVVPAKRIESTNKIAITPSLAELENLPKVTTLEKCRQFQCKLQKRTSFSVEQTKQLEDEFARKHYPDLSHRTRLATRIGVPEPKVNVWFNNRRAKFRKEDRIRWEKFKERGRGQIGEGSSNSQT